MADWGYGQFCPVAMASEVLGTRWTMLVVRELLCGSHRFNDLRRGLPHISPALLSKRLRELEELGVVRRHLDPNSGTPLYELTEAGEELRPVIMAMGCWGQRWLETQLSMKNLDPSLLMWDMRRNLNPDPLPPHRVTIQFLYHDVTPGQAKWWVVFDKSGEDGVVDLCKKDPGHDVDLYVVSDLRSMTAIWMGLMTVQEALDAGKLQLTGSRQLQSSMQTWLGLSVFADEPKRVSA
ncbi:helix-turn-helix transcriptional regulator [Halomonas campisalis]|uniref:Helix-turn-helix transcriptional regulator n=1 Tax=Billgrantia campisalis TaxID=74661 RepID=A0ABS9P893_9GAMM|nr:helix-turn-helix domain-containing protein [Halomonas campisalis]MCG6657978.1 helix-turn-helix transcriptional regulator [Halomonas campisalis]MDR5863497.1 helix-turn-helix domain-containing protein [Halomonas campisalis]